MRLLTLGLTNFKSFAGDHRIVLPDRGAAKPVYLIGGLNGSGKTTLAQAVVLALHGERAGGIPGLFDGGRGARDRYHRWLRAAFNQVARAAGDDQMRTSVQLSDGSGQLTVTRTWWFDAAGRFIEEQMEVREEMAGETELSVGDDAQALIDQVLPRHLLDFAIFDGERVRKLDDTLSATAVRSALDRLLNLDAVERMRAEIERLARERRLAHANATQLAIYEDLGQELTDHQEERAAVAEELRQAEDAQERMQRELDQLATAFDAAISAASTPGQLSADLVGLRERRAGLRSRLGRHLGDWLYLWPAFDVLSSLASDVDAQGKQRTGRDRLKLELEAVESLAEHLAADGSLRRKIGAAPINEFRRWLQAEVDERQSNLDAALIEAQEDGLASFSDPELADISVAISGAQRDLTDVQELAADLLRVDRRVREMEDLLAAADRDSTTAQLLRRRDELNVLLGEQRATAERLRSEVEEHDAALASLRSQLAGVEGRLNVSDDDQRWLITADATAAALDEFLADARAEASRAVQQRMLYNLRTLMRKDNLVTDVVIDPATHVTRLLGADGNDVELPSAGEHQLAAMAFIDAVLAAAENPIPVFVDTPLARLDSHHRRAVVKDFWPSLGRQVIVLSTDEEVVDDLLLFAEPAVAATYHIECDSTGASSITKDRYLEAAAS
ncbi:MAG: DNA sulfur modification protein DndD [Acidimicrobiales bacterium]